MVKMLLGFLTGLEDQANWTGYLENWLTQQPPGGAGKLGSISYAVIFAIAFKA